jgi:hypothetical protein
VEKLHGAFVMYTEYLSRGRFAHGGGRRRFGAFLPNAG